MNGTTILFKIATRVCLFSHVKDEDISVAKLCSSSDSSSMGAKGSPSRAYNSFSPFPLDLGIQDLVKAKSFCVAIII